MGELKDIFEATLPYLRETIRMLDEELENDS